MFFDIFIPNDFPQSSNRKNNLYRIKYILRLSYAQTLACKYKSIVHAFLKRLCSKVLEEFLIEEEQVWWYVNELVHYINETL
ncbi:hypothetical protein VitviT2T_002195 [Vitis vinifera]|uniref:Domain X domain-containing protein n=2 Tax=Vitis vinifera TaxID=29760 RepID=A0ABY9BIY3_VITVI